MSFNLRNIREVSNDPLAKFTNQIAKQLSAFLTKDQIDALEDQEDIYADGQDIDTVIKFHDELESTNKFQFLTQYYPPLEPDGDKLRLWLRGYNLGNILKDWSLTSGKICSIFGDPSLIDGTPFDSGIHTNGVKSTAIRFNRPTSDFVNTEYMSVDGSGTPTLEIDGITIGKSYFIRFRVSSLASQGGLDRTLFEKVDDSTPTDGIQVQLTSSGRIQVSIKRDGTEYNNQTETGTILVNTVYDVWITYAVSGNVTKVYVNNVDKTLSAGSSPSWHSTLTDNDLFIFRKGTGTNGGFVEGDFYDFRVYNEKVVSSTEVGYMNTNKWTIANIPFGQVMVANYFSTYWTIGSSFTSASFTSTSFDL